MVMVQSWPRCKKGRVKAAVADFIADGRQAPMSTLFVESCQEMRNPTGK